MSRKGASPHFTIRIRASDRAAESCILLAQGDFILGRDPKADVRIADEQVSRRHLRIHIEEGSVRICDIGSTNGTYIGAHRLELGQELKLSTQQWTDGIRLGSSVWLYFAACRNSQPTATRVPIELEGQVGSDPPQAEPPLQQPSTPLPARQAPHQAQYEFTQLDDRATALHAEVTKLQSVADSLRTEVSNLDTQTESLRLELARLDARTAARRTELTQVDSRAGSLRAEVTELDSRAGSLRAEVASIETHLEDLVARQEQAERQHDERERSHQSRMHSLEAESRLQTLRRETEIGELDLKKIAADRELQVVLARHDPMVVRLKEMEARLEEVRGQLSEKSSKRDALNEEITALTAAVEQNRAMATEARAETRRLQEEIEAHAGRIASQREALTAEEAAARQQMQGEFEAYRSQVHEDAKKNADELLALARFEASNAREEARAEVDRLQKLAESQRLEIEEARVRGEEGLRDALKRERLEKFALLDRELSEARRVETEQLAIKTAEAEKWLRDRRRSIVAEIADGALQLLAEGRLENERAELESMIGKVLNGTSTSAASAGAQERSRHFWRTTGLRAAALLLLALVGYLLRDAPDSLGRRMDRTIASESSKTDVFLEQIRREAMRYEPPTNREYRTTYADNVLYLEGYLPMKTSRSAQREWTLALNDFIVGRLGLSDRIIPEFISIESVMVTELARVREGILPKYVEQGLARMSEVERLDGEKLIRLLDGPENYAKFRAFERSFYETRRMAPGTQ